MHLPVELCEAIVDHISPDDRHTLKNCTLVCHFFAVRAQKILFKSISLGRPSKGFKFSIQSLRHPSRRFFALINSSPRLSGYVEHLEITDNAHLNFYREELSWIRRDAILSDIITRLGNLRGLSLSGNITGNRLNFRAWNEELKHSIRTKCRSPLLTKISLSFVRNVPTSILTQAPALESIYIFKSVFIVDGTPNASRKPKLKALEVTMTTYFEWSALYPWLLDEEVSVDLTGVTNLSLHVDPIPDGGPEGAIESINAISWVVRQCAATVKHLRLFYPFEVSSSMMASNSFVDLSTMPNLRSLSLHGALWTDQIPNEPPSRLPWLISTLRRIPQPSLLERVSLLASIEYDVPVTSEFGSADWAGFAQVIDQLAAAAEVEVFVTLFEECGPEIQTVIEDRLRGLRERGIIHVRRVAETQMLGDFD